MHPGGGGGHSTFFFGGCVPRGFQNVGSREQIFLENWESWEQKFRSRELEFKAKTWQKIQKFPKN